MLAYLQCTKTGLEIGLMVICLSGMVLLGGQSIMQSYFNTLAASLANTSRQHGEHNHEIKRINALVKNTDKIQSGYTEWTATLLAVSQTVPPPVTLSGMTLDAKRRLYTFTGMAPTRDDLFAFKTNLEALPAVERVDIPLSQLTVKEQIPFSFTVTLK